MDHRNPESRNTCAMNRASERSNAPIRHVSSNFSKKRKPPQSAVIQAINNWHKSSCPTPRNKNNQHRKTAPVTETVWKRNESEHHLLRNSSAASLDCWVQFAHERSRHCQTTRGCGRGCTGAAFAVRRRGHQRTSGCVLSQ